MANVRKLMRLAREYELDEGRDLRGFIDYIDEQDLVQAREAEAPLEGEGLDAIRLMTIHAAKGLEFPCVCVADLGRNGHGDDDALRVTRDGSMGLRMASLHGTTEKSPEYERIQAESDAEVEQEERRIFYVAMTRAREHLVLSGGTDFEKLPEPRPLAAPATWVWRALWPEMAERLAAGEVEGEADWTDPEGGTVRLRYALGSPGSYEQLLPRELWQPAASREDVAEVAGPPPAFPEIAAAKPLPVSRLSYSALASYDACAYRFYAERVLRLPRPDDRARQAALRAAAVEEKSGQFSLTDDEPEAVAAPEPLLSALDRGSVVHELLERLDFAAPLVPDAAAVRDLLEARGLEASDRDVESVRSFIASFTESELLARIAGARKARRELPFVFNLPPEAGRRDSLLVNGVMDVHAVEHDGTALVLDYKTDPVGEGGTEALVGASYSTQRLVYALAALKAGAERVEVVHLFLERPDEPAVQTFTADELPALEAELQGLAAGLVGWQFAPTQQPHRGLCATCAARPGLCSWDEDRTLADLRATVPG
jgi:ATP-dependent exoDNAse (exonuclease V) beta subunit